MLSSRESPPLVSCRRILHDSIRLLHMDLPAGHHTDAQNGATPPCSFSRVWACSPFRVSPKPSARCERIFVWSEGTSMCGPTPGCAPTLPSTCGSSQNHALMASFQQQRNSKATMLTRETSGRLRGHVGERNRIPRTATPLRTGTTRPDWDDQLERLRTRLQRRL